MGADGGSIPKRCELVKEAKREVSDSQKEETIRLARWHLCALSKAPLQEPVVACGLGRLYNKEAFVSFLLDKKLKIDEITVEMAEFSHLNSLKDVSVLQLTPNPHAASTGNGNGSIRKVGLDQSSNQESHFICPITRREMSGTVRFYFLKGCGCTVSEQALKELKIPYSYCDVVTQCPICDLPLKVSCPWTPLNPTLDDEVRLRKGLAASSAKRKKLDNLVDLEKSKRDKVIKSSTPLYEPLQAVLDAKMDSIRSRDALRSLYNPNV